MWRIRAAPFHSCLWNGITGWIYAHKDEAAALGGKLLKMRLRRSRWCLHKVRQTISHLPSRSLDENSHIQFYSTQCTRRHHGNQPISTRYKPRRGDIHAKKRSRIARHRSITGIALLFISRSAKTSTARDLLISNRQGKTMILLLVNWSIPRSVTDLSKSHFRTCGKTTLPKAAMSKNGVRFNVTQNLKEAL